MTIYIYDIEVFLHDWIAVFMDFETQEFFVFHNDAEDVANFIDDAIYIGFNSKFYDQYILKAICCGCDNYEIKELSDYLISGGHGWEHPLMEQIRYWFNNVDIRDDTQQGLSLKAIEGHLGMAIEESSVDFDLERHLTAEELEEVVHYCKHDVEATAELVKLRKDYLCGKIQVGQMAGLEAERSLRMTNAKLTAAFLKARKPVKPWKDEREYEYPDNLRREYIPQEVFDFFDRMRDPAIPDKELFKSKLVIDLKGTPAVIGFGGIHAAIDNYKWEERG